MFKITINETEYEQLKVLADFLLFDQHAERLTFPRFEECMGILTKKQNFPLKDIFVEICGENRKFITFPRLVRAFLEYKTNHKGRSVEFKNFFGYIFKEVIRDINQLTGRDIPGSGHFSTAQHKNRECITELRVYSNKENEIQALYLEYDELLKNEFVCPSANKDQLNLKIRLRLKILEDLDNDGELDEDDVRDYITHVFGTVSTKIEFLGFKCSSGKMYYTGDASKGTPFLLGKNETKFHYLKLGVKDGMLTYIKPYFTESTTCNMSLDVELKDITNEFLINNDKIFEDEEYLKTINSEDRKEYLKNVLIPAFDDDCFFQEDDSDICGDDLYEVYSCVSFCSSHEEGEGHHHQEIIEEDLLEDLMPLENNKVAEESKNNKEEINLEITKSTLINNTNDVWDKISPRTLNCASLFTNNQNLEALVEKYREDISNEIVNKKNKRKLQEQNSENFYLKYINRDNQDAQRDSNLEVDKRTETEFNLIVRRSEDALRNLRCDEVEEEEIVIEYYEEDEFGNIRKLSGEEKKKYLPLEEKEVKAKWRQYTDYLKRKVIRFGISAAFGIAKAIEILKNVENEFEDTTNSLETKVKVFDILTKLIEKRRILKSFAESEGGLLFIKRKLLAQIKENTSNSNNKRETIIVEKPNMEKYITTQFEPKDINRLNKNIEKLEKQIKENKDKEIIREIEHKLDFLRKQKSLAVEKKKDNIKKQMSGTININLEKIKKEQEEKRKIMILQRKDEARQRKQKEEEETKSLLTIPVTFGELDLPKDLEIYRSQEIVKGQIFTDEKFKPENTSLCPIDADGNWVLPEGVDEEDLQDWETFEWKRVAEVFKSQDYQVFVKGIEAADIIQGSLGDCYFLSAVAGLCKFPELIEKLFLFKEKSNDGCYGVYLRINGMWELVLVDDLVPCFGSFRKKFAFSNANGKELWVVLIEKAWAKLNGSYAKAIAGQPSEVFDSICNAYTETVSISSNEKEIIWNKIHEGELNNYIMTAGTGTNTSKLNYDDVNLVVGHAYTILSALEVTSNGIMTRLIKIRNPWGNGEWSGDWSDSSNKWTQKLRSELVGEEADDGVFFMSYDDFIKYYVTLGICKIHKDFVYSFLKFKKNDTMKPQVVSVNVSKDTKAFIQIHQKNPRFLLANGKYGQPTLSFILLVDENMNYLASATGDSNNIAIEIDLKMGKYFLYTDINYRYVDINDLHGYNITTYSQHSITLNRDESINHMDILRKGLISYSKAKIEPIKENDALIYLPKGYSSLFPFSFTVVDNQSKSEVEVEYCLNNVKSRVRTACLFPDSELGDSDKIVKIIPQQQSDVFISLKFKAENRIETSWKVKSIFSDDQLESLTKEQGTREDLDEDGNISQIYYNYKGGYGLVLENKSKNILKMKLEVENLSYNNSIENEIFFDINGNSEKFFNLKIVPNAKSISFNFNFAD